MSRYKQKVRAAYPDAIAERRKTNGGEVYWLIRAHRRAFMPFADGATEAQAWRAAAAKVEGERPGPEGEP